MESKREVGGVGDRKGGTAFVSHCECFRRSSTQPPWAGLQGIEWERVWEYGLRVELGEGREGEVWGTGGGGKEAIEGMEAGECVEECRLRSSPRTDRIRRGCVWREILGRDETRILGYVHAVWVLCGRVGVRVRMCQCARSYVSRCSVLGRGGGERGYVCSCVRAWDVCHAGVGAGGCMLERTHVCARAQVRASAAASPG